MRGTAGYFLSGKDAWRCLQSSGSFFADVRVVQQAFRPPLEEEEATLQAGLLAEIFQLFPGSRIA
ncbi:MAG: hypothetical protein HYU64_00185 [Armatimonadetes bacterium]|nr:hypothetical protein [Armatimonadota bacterium]